uniref:Secreted protein n=1 Tax=Parascaris univalens TaxID=6257 RepID=A0A915BXK8_PARUN
MYAVNSKQFNIALFTSLLHCPAPLSFPGFLFSALILLLRPLRMWYYLNVLPIMCVCMLNSTPFCYIYSFGIRNFIK